MPGGCPDGPPPGPGSRAIDQARLEWFAGPVLVLRDPTVDGLATDQLAARNGRDRVTGGDPQQCLGASERTGIAGGLDEKRSKAARSSVVSSNVGMAVLVP